MKDGCYNLLLAAAGVRGWTAQLSDISSGATCVADLDSRALALTKEASGNSRESKRMVTPQLGAICFLYQPRVH